MYKDGKQAMWYDTMATAVKQTIIISEILDTRTRHLVQARPLRLPAKLVISMNHCLVSCLCAKRHADSHWQPFGDVRSRTAQETSWTFVYTKMTALSMHERGLSMRSPVSRRIASSEKEKKIGLAALHAGVGRERVCAKQ